MSNTKEKVESVEYQLVKVGELFVKEVDMRVDCSSENKEPRLYSLLLTWNEDKARKWCYQTNDAINSYDNFRAECNKEHEESYMKEFLEILKKDGIKANIIKCKITTTVETEVMWMDVITEKLKSLNKQKERKKNMKHVIVFGKGRDKVSDKYNELKEQFLPEIKREYNKPYQCSFETEELSVKAVLYSDSFRGKRCDEIYVDSELSINDLKNIELMKKDKYSRLIFY